VPTACHRRRRRGAAARCTAGGSCGGRQSLLTACSMAEGRTLRSPRGRRATAGPAPLPSAGMPSAQTDATHRQQSGRARNRTVPGRPDNLSVGCPHTEFSCSPKESRQLIHQPRTRRPSPLTTRHRLVQCRPRPVPGWRRPVRRARIQPAGSTNSTSTTRRQLTHLPARVPIAVLDAASTYKPNSDRQMLDDRIGCGP
jgi:hypothetical protein